MPDEPISGGARRSDRATYLRGIPGLDSILYSCHSRRVIAYLQSGRNVIGSCKALTRARPGKLGPTGPTPHARCIISAILQERPLSRSYRIIRREEGQRLCSTFARSKNKPPLVDRRPSSRGLRTQMLNGRVRRHCSSSSVETKTNRQARRSSGFTGISANPGDLSDYDGSSATTPTTRKSLYDSGKHQTKPIFVRR
jgi:hypothetical protein